MSKQRQLILYVTPDADRFFLVPARHALPAGGFALTTLDGQEQLADAQALRRFEVSRDRAQAHFHALLESALASLSAATDPREIEAALERSTDQVRQLAAALAAGDPEELGTARETLSGHGLALGDAIDDLARYLRATREVDEPAATIGRSVDASIKHLEHALGPLTGLDALAEPRRRKEEYARSARSAIGDALRATGITPLGSDPEPTPRPD